MKQQQRNFVHYKRNKSILSIIGKIGEIGEIGKIGRGFAEVRKPECLAGWPLQKMEVLSTKL